MRKNHRGIFCLEGDWWNDLNRSSTVKPVMKLLCQASDGIVFVHRDVGTMEEFNHYLKKWVQRARAKYSVLYLAFHGAPGSIYVGDGYGNELKLDALADRLAGKCKGKLIHFGSCSTLDGDKRSIQRFLRISGATAVTGFRTDVDWLKSSAFETLLFEIIFRGSLTLSGASRIERSVQDEMRGLAKQLGFRIVIRRD